jgi:hypothetical protein
LHSLTPLLKNINLQKVFAGIRRFGEKIKKKSPNPQIPAQIGWKNFSG